MTNVAEVLSEELEMTPVAELTPHPRNPRLGDVGAIARSIERNGFYGAVVAQRSTGRILAGEHRWRAAQTQGLEVIPVLYADVDDATALRILLADNRTNDVAGYEATELASLLAELAAADDLEGTGWDAESVQEQLDNARGILPDPGDANVNDVIELWGVVIEVATETEQVTLLERFSAEGLKVRAMMA